MGNPILVTRARQGIAFAGGQHIQPVLCACYPMQAKARMCVWSELKAQLRSPRSSNNQAWPMAHLHDACLHAMDNAKACFDVSVFVMPAESKEQQTKSRHEVLHPRTDRAIDGYCCPANQTALLYVFICMVGLGCWFVQDRKYVCDATVDVHPGTSLQH